ncbi:glycosyltransferase family 4 protein [Kineococcus sp. SYSU DK005]|uniref:glycosyltransferase family 4 protein n=1 Tax=Kineococcus sp. SYSU DK005 TaxID=3383126 RepID=UPI003D7CAFA7
MRIIHVLTTDTFSGLERYAVDVSTVLAARGHEVLVAGGDPAAMRDRLPTTVHWAPGATLTEAFTTLRAAGRVDVVHSHITKADFAAFAAAPWSRAARVSTRHINAARGYTRFARLAARPVRATLRAEIAVSRFTADALPDGRPDEVLLNGVADVPAHRIARDRTVLIAQRLSAEKDTSVGLEGFALSSLARNGWRLLIAGRGDERVLLEQLSHQLGIADHVDFLEWVDDMESLYETAGILLATAPAEPFGLTVLEAAAHALPVLAAGSGGHLETVGSLPAAALFTPKDPRSVAEELSKLAVDADRRAAYGAELRTLQQQRFTLMEHVEKLESLYRRAVSGAS